MTRIIGKFVKTSFREALWKGADVHVLSEKDFEENLE